jgi:hypothetical protein
MSTFITNGDGTLVSILQEGGERFASIPESRRDTYSLANAGALISGHISEDEIGPSVAERENRSAVIDD